MLTPKGDELHRLSSMFPQSFLSPLAGRSLVWLFIVAFCIRLLVIANLYGGSFSAADQGDMQFYSLWAQRILSGHWTNQAAFYGLPGYAFLLAGIYKFFGTSTLAAGVLQALAEACVAVLIGLVANLILRKRGHAHAPRFASVAAGLSYALYQPAQAYSGILMPTCWLVVFFWWLVWWCARDREKKISILNAGAVGLGIGVMATTVATILFIIPLAIAALWQKSHRPLRAITLLLAGVLLGCSPVILHNRLIAHDSVLLSAHGGLNFFLGNNQEANGYLTIPPGMRANQAHMLDDSIAIARAALGTPPGEKIPLSAVSSYWSAKANTYIRENPLAWLRLLGQKVINFWNAYQYDDLSVIDAFAQEGITTPGLRFGIVAALGLAGMVAALASKNIPARWVIAAVLLHMTALLPVFITERYRMAAVPGLLILGTYFLVQLWDNAASSRWKPVLLQTTTVLAAVAFVTMPVPNQGAWALDAYNNGLRHLAARDWPKATSDLQLAWRYAPESEHTNLAVGNLYLGQGDLPRAAAFYQRSLRINPKNASALNNLGNIAFTQNSPAEAIRFFSEALTVAPNHLAAIYQLALAYRANHQLPEARAIIEKALTLHPERKELLDLRSELATPPAP
ncbi:MAG TPA: tetratricopeptide repeat protein [Chthoniobacterales bacterium]